MSESSEVSKANQGTDNSIPKFLKILYQLLEDKANSELITWTQDGRAIAIKDPAEFSDKLLSIYFKHSNYSSFVRQLNLYNFKKKKNYPIDNTFAHTMFLRGRRDLLKLIKRKNSHASQAEKDDMKMGVYCNEGELDELTEQNLCLKKVHKDMAERIETLEQAVKGLSERNEDLRHSYLKKKLNEDLLKKVVNGIAKIYGEIKIRGIIESLAVSGFTHSLNLKATALKPIEGKRIANRHANYMLDKDDFHYTYNQADHPKRTDYSADRRYSDRTISTPSLSIPQLRTISSFSTNPELHPRDDPYPDNEQEEFGLANQISFSSQLHLRSGGFRDDFSFSGENKGESRK